MNCESATLITGATAGIGRQLADEFARRGHSLILVATDAAALEGLALELQMEHDIKTCCIVRDLEDPEAAAEIQHEVQQRGLVVDVLVNTADRGFRGESWAVPIAQCIAIVRINIEATVRLTHCFLPPMLERRQGRILNSASIAGFEGGPLLNVYHASKAFILSWSEGLAAELKLKGTPVTVTALCPGITDADSFPIADREALLAFHHGSTLSPHEVARAGYEGAMAGQLIVVPGMTHRAPLAGRQPPTRGAPAKHNGHAKTPPP